mmetsp:Transcript_33884/g.84447  ORF Transcript_33884/g.84447 Transcript_33884/m.84447 type:complete len:218 (-) Transcript_33884:298-951(-)
MAATEALRTSGRWRCSRGSAVREEREVLSELSEALTATSPCTGAMLPPPLPCKGPSARACRSWKVCTKTPSTSRAPTAAVSVESSNLKHVNSPWDIVPLRGPSARISSTVALRRVAIQRPSNIGEERLMSSAGRGAERVAPTRRERRVEPKKQRAHAANSTLPMRSLLMSAAAATVHRMSVPCSSRCVEVGSNIRPRLVTEYLSPNRKPMGATVFNL